MLREVSLPEAKLSVFDAGQGPALLLVHGFPLDHRMWFRQFGPLAAQARLLAPDLRGFGRSRWPASGSGVSTMEQFADDLAAMLDALEVREPVTLCGLSMGGYVAWQFWKRHAARLRGLILCDTRAAGDGPEARAARGAVAERVRAEGPRFLAEAMLPKLLAPGSQADAELVALLRTMIAEASPEGVAAAALGMGQRPDVSGWLREIHVPALVVCGAEDAISPLAEMSAFAAELPQAEFVALPGAGHMAPCEQPQAFLAAVLRFLAGLPR